MGKAPPRNSLQGLDIAGGADRDRTGDPLVAKPNDKVPRFYKLLNLRAVLGIGVEVEGPLGAPYCEKLTTQLTTDECGFRQAALRDRSLSPQPRQIDE